MATVGIRDMKDWLYNSNLDITPKHLVGLVSYTQMSNDETKNLHLGSACSSKIEFEVQDFGENIGSLAGAELIYEKLTESTSELFDLKLSPTQIINGNYLYIATNSAPFIQIYSNGGEFIKDVSSTPPMAVSLFMIRDGFLYALHIESPYVTKYLISGQDLIAQARPTLSAYQIEQILRYINARASINIASSTVTYYETRLYNGSAQALVATAYTRVRMGYFTCEQPSTVNTTRHKVVAYDRMAKLDKDVSAWVDSRTYPITIRNLQTQLCSYCDVPFDGVSFVNETYVVNQNFTGENITGRQVQQWITEAAGGHALINRSGQLGIKTIQSSGMRLSPSEYTKAELADYQISKIGQVTVRVSEEDVGVAVPPTGGSNPYVIQNNPLLYATSDAQLRPAVTNIFNVVQSILYTPGTMTAFADPAIDAGNYVSVQNGSTAATVLAMSVVWKGNQVTYDGYGERDFSNVAPANIQITALNRKTNTLTRTLDETRSELADAQGNITTLTQTVNGISTTVQDQNGKITTLEQTSTSLTATVGGLKSAQDATKLTFDASGLTIKNGGFKIINSSNTTTFSVNGTTGAVSLTGSISTTADSNDRRFTLNNSGLTFYSGNTNVGQLFIENPQNGNSSVLSVDWLSIRNNSQTGTQAALFRYDSSLGVTRLTVDRLDADIINGKSASWSPVQTAGSLILIGQ